VPPGVLLPPAHTAFWLSHSVRKDLSALSYSPQSQLERVRGKGPQTTQSRPAEEEPACLLSQFVYITTWG